MHNNPWRLPTIQELLTLVNYTKEDPASLIIDYNSYQTCWSSTPHANNLVNGHWTIHFGIGITQVQFDTQKFYVRAVKTLDNGELEWSKVSKKSMLYKEIENYIKQNNFIPN
jgi:hypothetical protein